MAEVENINVTPDITEDPEYVSQFYVAFQYTTQDTKVPGTGCCYTRTKYTVPTYQDITDIAASIKRDMGYTSVIIISLKKASHLPIFELTSITYFKYYRALLHIISSPL